MKICKYLLFIILFSCQKETSLPILSKYIDDEGNVITYKIQDFEVINQNNKPINSDFTIGKNYLANFFFTRCPSICPPMGIKLKEVLDENKDNNLLALSFTIDPKNDTNLVLKEYATKINNNQPNWLFLRGSDYELKKIASLFRTSFTNTNNLEDFYHSSYVALVDKDQQIRGFYDILNSNDLEKLKVDIKKLYKEQ